jgi:hypothetical protein
MPPVPVVNTSVTVPIQGYTVVNSTGIPSDGPDAMFFFYAVDIQSYTFPGSDTVVTASNNTILDSGTTFNLLPDDVAAVFATGFNPPATLITSPLNDRPIYIVDCNATAPKFQVTLGGKRFSIDPRDQIVASGKFDNGTIACASGTQPISAISPGFDTQFILYVCALHQAIPHLILAQGGCFSTQRCVDFQSDRSRGYPHSESRVLERCKHVMISCSPYL